MTYAYGELLKGFRQREGLTQGELADCLGVHRNSISVWERSAYLPGNREMVLDLADALFLSPAETDQLLAAAQYPPASQTQIEPERVALPDRPSTQQDWGEAPDVDIFHGRRREGTELERWLTADRCRVVAVLGIGGIGKTALATKVARQSADHFHAIIWRSLRNAPPVEEIVADWIRLLSNQQVVDLPVGIDRQITLLLEYLRQHRCLLVLDNVEAILREGDGAGLYHPSYEGYGEVLRRVGENQHQSCLLLTSREKPRDVAIAEWTAAPVKSLELTTLEIAAGRAMLEGSGLVGTDIDWATLVEAYSGNPLALKLIAETVRELFGGDIAAFLQDGVLIFGGVSRLLDQHFARLSALEKALMVWLTITREAVEPEYLCTSLIPPVSKRELLEALLSLRRRSLVERRDLGFTLQNVVMEYVTARLIDAVGQELTQTLPTTNVPAPLAWCSRYPLIEAQAKAYVRASQTRLILQPIAEQLLAQLGPTDLEHLFQARLGQLRQQSQKQQGYAAGNLLNLLLYLGRDLKGWDFSELAVWQAYLQGISLQDVDFTGADLRGARFTEIFGNVSSVAYSPQGDIVAVGTSLGQIRLWRATDGEPLLILEGHVGQVLAVAFSPDGQTLASGCDDQTVRLWDVANPKGVTIIQPLKTLTGHTNTIWSLAFSPDGRTLASGCADLTARLWDVTNLASSKSDATVEVGLCRDILVGHTNGVLAVAFSPDSQILASGSGDHTVRLWDASDQPRSDHGQLLTTLEGHTNAVWAVAFTPDGQMLASGSKDQTVRLWDLSALKTGAIPASFDAYQTIKILVGHAGWVRSLALSPDGQVLVTGSTDQTIRLWDLANSTGPDAVQTLRTLAGHSDWVHSVALSPDGRTLVSGSWDHTVRLWDVTNPQGVGAGHAHRILSAHTNEMNAVAFSPDGQTLASVSTDRTVRLWDVANPRGINHGQPLKTLHGHTGWVDVVAFSPDGRALASGSTDQTVRLWDVADPTQSDSSQCRSILTSHTHEIKSLAFSPDGRTLASGGGDEMLRLWDVESGQLRESLAGFSQEVMAVAFGRALGSDAEGAPTLAAGSYDRTIRLWSIANQAEAVNPLNAETNQPLVLLTPQGGRVEALAFSPNGAILASGGDDQLVHLWEMANIGDLAGGQPRQSLAGHTSRIYALAFGPDGRTLASGSNDQTIHLWDVADVTGSDCQSKSTPCRLIKVLAGHTGSVMSVAFSPNGSLLASSSKDGTIRLWDMTNLRTVGANDCLKTLRPDRPYERLNISGATGIAGSDLAARDIGGGSQRRAGIKPAATGIPTPNLERVDDH